MFYYYIEQIKNWKKLNGYRKNQIRCDLIANAILMMLGVFLYLSLNNTGLLIYIILILKLHWLRESK